jgi:hypothetical protein
MVKKRKLGRGVAIVGAGMSKFGMFRDKDSKDVFAEAFSDLLSSVDKGQRLFYAPIPLGTHHLRFDWSCTKACNKN